MKLKKVIISLLLIIPLLPLGTFAGDFSSADNYALLVNLGIAENDDVLSNPELTVSRAQFVRYAVKSTGLPVASLVSDGDVLPFADISSEHEDYTYIIAAVKLGFITGSNGLFLPDSPITMQAAAKIAIHVLDYQILAETAGGYPVGYLKYANEFDLFDGCEISDEQKLTSGDVCQIFVNMLNSNVFETTAIGSEGNEYAPMENLLSRRHGVYTADGIVDANAYTSLVTPSGLGDSAFVSIDGISYNVGNMQGAYAYLGQSVTAYYKEASSGARTLIYMLPGVDNDIITLSSKDIENVSLMEISYDESGKEQNLKISKSASVILNGTFVSVTGSNISDILKPQVGTVTFIDNDGNGSMDVINVESYRTVLVSGISAKTYSVADGLGGESLTLDPNDKYYDVYIEKDGKRVSFDDIAVNNVISYYESADETKALKKLIISDKSVKGAIDEVDSSQNKFAIDGIFYDVSDYMAKSLDIGMSGVFYLDSFGTIAQCRTDELDIVYGYITGIAKQSALGNYEAKIFTENNRWVILPLAKKIRYNGSSKTASELYSELGGENMTKQLVTYLVSSDRELIRLDTAKIFEANSEEEKQAISKQTFRHSASYASIAYRADGPSFDDRCYISDTIIFSVPLENSNDYTYSDDKYEILSISDLVNSGLYKVDAYDMDEYGNAKACVIPYRNKSASSSEALMIVDHITDAVNSEGTVVKAIRGFYYGIEAKILLAENISDTHAQNVAKLNKGDVIRVSTNKSGYAVAISDPKLIDFKTEGADVKKMVGTSYGIGTFFAGEVKAVTASESLIAVDCGYDGGQNAIHRLSSLKTVYIFNRDANTMITGSISDISVGDYVYMTSRYLRVESVIVVK